MKSIKLKLSEQSGDGHIDIPEEWNTYDTLLRMDILKDWIYSLQQEYDSTYIKYLAENTIRRAKHER